jgi:hypothetical protein
MKVFPSISAEGLIVKEEQENEENGATDGALRRPFCSRVIRHFVPPTNFIA